MSFSLNVQDFFLFSFSLLALLSLRLFSVKWFDLLNITSHHQHEHHYHHYAGRRATAFGQEAKKDLNQ